jgi:hypothetical protein
MHGVVLNEVPHGRGIFKRIDEALDRRDRIAVKKGVGTGDNGGNVDGPRVLNLNECRAADVLSDRVAASFDREQE